MIVEKYDGTPERVTLIGMVVDRTVVARISTRWPQQGEGPFASVWANLIGKWCVDHFKQYDIPIRKDIESRYQEWVSKKGRDKDTVRLIEKLLQQINGEYETHAEEINPQFVIDTASKHFARVRVDRTIDLARGTLETGDVFKAEEVLNEYKRVGMGGGKAVDLINDNELLDAAFAEQPKSIIDAYPDAMKAFFRSALARDSFIAFAATEKKGKTWVMVDMAWRAMTSHLKTAFFEIGDLSEHQIVRRFGVRGARYPMRPTKIKKPKSIKVVGDSYQIEFGKEINYKKVLSAGMVKEEWDKLKKGRVNREGYLKLSCAPAGTVSVRKIKDTVEEWQAEGWNPDVIIIDYADLIEAPPGYKESRDKINKIWESLRALSSQAHCLVVTATQANRSAYDANLLSMKHSSEDKRKCAHVNGMIGVNQTAGEKREGVYRWNWMNLREEEYDTEKCVYMAGCLALGNPCMVAALPDWRGNNKDEDQDDDDVIDVPSRVKSKVAVGVSDDD